MTNDEILQAAKEAGYGTAFYLNDDKPAHEEIWGGPMETQKVRSLIKIIEKRTLERCAAYLTSGRYMILNPSVTYTAAQHILAIKAHDKHQAAAIRKLGEQ